MDPHKKLAAAVIIHALKDAQEGCQKARRWILEDEFGFPIWCRAYGVCPVRARQRMRKAIRKAPVTRERRQELVVQAIRENPELSNREIGQRVGCNYETVRQVRINLPLEASFCGENRKSPR